MECLYCEKPLDRKEEVMIKVTSLGCSSCKCIVLVLKDDDNFNEQEVNADEEF